MTDEPDVLDPGLLGPGAVQRVQCRAVWLLGGEQQHQLAQRHVPHQPPVAAALEVAEADLGLGQAEHVLDPRPRERDLQQRQQAVLGGALETKYFTSPVWTLRATISQ